MQRSNSFWLGVGILGAVVLLGGIFFYSHSALAPTSTTLNNMGSSTTTTLPGGASITTNGGAQVEMIPPAGGTTAPPSLTGAINISSTLPADAQTLLLSKEQALIAQLKQNPTRADLWLSLGVDRKIGGDYAGAIEAWNYVAYTAPSSISYIAYGNSAEVYMDFLKDYPKAEQSYKQAIALNPHIVSYYRDLYTLYKYLYKTNTTAASDILAQGLKANPGNADLLALQAQAKTGAQ